MIWVFRIIYSLIISFFWLSFKQTDFSLAEGIAFSIYIIWFVEVLALSFKHFSSARWRVHSKRFPITKEKINESETTHQMFIKMVVIWVFFTPSLILSMMFYDDTYASFIKPLFSNIAPAVMYSYLYYLSKKHDEKIKD